jgi:hypothetical protein
MDEKSFESFRENAERNRMFIRAAAHKQLTAEQEKQVDDALERSKKAHEDIYKVQKEMEKAKIPFVIFKTMGNHPDMGLDVDFLVASKDFNKARDVVLDNFGGRVIHQSMASTLAGKVSITIGDSPITVEIHGGGFSQIGEYGIQVEPTIKHSRIVKLFGMDFRVPSNEDMLLIDVMHRIYRHMSIRFSDAYNTKKLLDEEKLDWGYILKPVEQAGMMPGLILFLDVVKKYGDDIETLGKFPYFVGKRDFLKNYFAKVLSDALHLRVASLLRMLTIYPALLVLESLFGKRIKNTFW